MEVEQENCVPCMKSDRSDLSNDAIIKKAGFSFMNLPSEIRIEIYKHTAKMTTLFIPRLDITTRDAVPAMLLVSKQVAAEYRGILLQRATVLACVTNLRALKKIMRFHNNLPQFDRASLQSRVPNLSSDTIPIVLEPRVPLSSETVEDFLFVEPEIYTMYGSGLDEYIKDRVKEDEIPRTQSGDGRNTMYDSDQDEPEALDYENIVFGPRFPYALLIADDGAYTMSFGLPDNYHTSAESLRCCSIMTEGKFDDLWYQLLYEDFEDDVHYHWYV